MAEKNSAEIAVNVLKEILAKDVIFPEEVRDFSLTEVKYIVPNYLQSFKFNMDHGELKDFMYSFENEGLIKILEDDIVLDHSRAWPDEMYDDYDPLQKAPVEDNTKKHINYEIKNLEGIKKFIEKLGGQEIITPILTKKSDFSNDSFYIFTLSKDGVLSRTIPSSESEKYEMIKDSIPYKIILSLNRSKGKTVKTKELVELTGAKNAKVIADAIYELKKAVEKNFDGIQKEDFIPEGKRGSGYCLGKMIRIKIER